MRLRTAVHGDGPLRVGLVHGLRGSGKTWRPLVGRILARGGRSVVTVDLRGHGSSPGAAGYTLAEYADDLVETLPRGLHALVGHGLGGAAAAVAAARLAPERAVYLDPAFRTGLPAGSWFWAVPGVARATVGARALAATPGRGRLAPEDRDLRAEARAGAARRIVVPPTADLTRRPPVLGSPPVPSTLVLSDDGRAGVPDALRAELETAGWAVRRVPGVHHELWLEDCAATFTAIRDLV